MSLTRRLASLASAAAACAFSFSSLLAHAQPQPLNASFETPVYASVGRNATPAGTSWTFAGTAGIERLQAHFYSTNSGGYNGLQAAYLSSTGTAGSLGSVAQTVNFPAAGQYTLRFLAGRLGAANALRITVGGVQIESDITPRALGSTGYPQLETWWTLPFTLSAAGDYEIKFAATQASATLSGGNVLLIDQVTVASVQFSLPNASFETTTGAAPVVATGWTLTNSTTGTTAISGAAGSNALVLGADSVTGKAQAVSISVPAGRYSISARLANSGASASCTPIFGYSVGGTNTALVSLPAPVYSDFIPYTSASFDLAAGSYAFYLSASCGSGATPPVIDSVIVNRAGPNFANASFESPDLGLPVSVFDTPRQYNPAGSSWSFAGSNVGIRGNPGSFVESMPYSESGRQHGFSFGVAGSSFSQSVVLDAGTYVVVSKAAVGPFSLSVNGTLQSLTLRGSRLRSPDGYNYMFSEVQSEPFTVATTSPVSLGFSPTESNAAGFSIDTPRIIQIGVNSPPQVSLALQVNGAAAPAVVASGGTLTAIATASDFNGLQRIRVLRNGAALAPESTATPPASATSPLTVTVSPLTTGTYSFVAEATDHLGAVNTATQSLKVLPDGALRNGSFEMPVQAAAGYTYNPIDTDWVFSGKAAIQRDGSVWGAPSAPDPVQTAVLQCGVGMTPGSITQDVAFSGATSIQISFQWATRQYAGQLNPQPIQLSIDGVNIALVGSTASASYVQYTSAPVSVAAGVRSIKLAATQCDTDRTTFIDQVSLAAANTPPVINTFSATPNGLLTATQAITLSASASDPDASGYVATLDFQYKDLDTNVTTVIAGQSCNNSPGAPQRPLVCNGKTWTPPAAGGRFELTVKATDNQGGNAASSVVPLTICGVRVALTSPVTSTLVISNNGNATTPISFAATATQTSTNASCGTITQVEFLLDGVPIGSDATAPYSLGPITYPTRGTAYSFTARVTDSQGRTATSAPVLVTVSSNNPPNIDSIILSSTSPRVANQTATARVFASDNTAVATITATVTGNGTTVNAGVTNCTPSASTFNCDVSWTPTASGLYVVTVTATDSQGGSAVRSQTFAISDPVGVTALNPGPTAPIGTTAGQFSVSESGAATYGIPIQVPPGVAGLQPGLALTYNSQGGDGHLGVGWGLSGLSSITRCPKTIATDGVREPINYDNVTSPNSSEANDAFCLDGQRLLPVLGGIASADCERPVFDSSGILTGTVPDMCKAWEFRTELESYSRIIGIGDNAWATNPVATRDGSGPTRFRVYAKSGQIIEYGSRWWGVSKPRPDNIISLVTNPGFEDTYVLDSTWTRPVSEGGAGTPFGYFKLNAEAKTQGPFGIWTFSDGGFSTNSAAGVQRNGSGFSTRQLGNLSWVTHPEAPEGQQTALLQGRGQASVTLQLQAGDYTLGFMLGGRGTSGGSGFSGEQTVQVRLNGSTSAVPGGEFITHTGDAFSSRSVVIRILNTGLNTITFAGTTPLDGTALLDAITLVPVNADVYSLKVFPLDRVEDRNGNYMHIDYGGTHTEETVVDSYGSAEIVLNAAGRGAQGARPRLEIYPRRITYGMRNATPGSGINAASVPDIEVARVLFNYESRNDQSTLFDTGAGQTLLSKRLSSIVTYVGGSDDTSTRQNRVDFHKVERGGANTAGICVTGAEASCGQKVRRYTLNYSESPSSKRSRLDSVQECGWDDVCLPATTFVWQDAATVTLNGSSQAANVAADGNVNWNNLLGEGRIGDVVGDGKTRVVRYRNGTSVSVCTYGGSQFTCADWAIANSGLPPLPDANNGDYTWALADFNGDSVADILVTPKGSSAQRAYACKANSSAVPPQFDGCIELEPKAGVRGGRPEIADKRYYSRTGDFDGDGRIDVLFYRGEGSWEVCLAPFTAGSCKSPVTLDGLPISRDSVNDDYNHFIVSDFNGDGRADLIFRVPDSCIANGVNWTATGAQCPVFPQTSDSYWGVCFAAGRGTGGNPIRFDCATRSGAGIAGAVKGVSGKTSKIASYDFNGDGIADLAAKVSGRNAWRICLSVGDGEFMRDGNGDCPIWDGPTYSSGPKGEPDKTIAGDFNGDGRTDLATWDNSANSWQVCLSTGAGFICQSVSGGALKPADCDGQCFEAFPGDYNGDGKTDIVVNSNCVSPSNPSLCGRLSYGFPNSVMPDLVSSVKTGLLAETKIRYLPLTNAGAASGETVYTRKPAGMPAVDDTQDVDIQSPMYVVRSTCASTGNASEWYKSEYSYAGLRASKLGRGLYGFYSRDIVDNMKVDSTCGTPDASQVPHTTRIVTSQIWPNVGRPQSVTKTVPHPFTPGQTVTVATTQNTYAARCKSSLTGVATACPAVGTTPGYRWEAFLVKSVQSGSDIPWASGQPSKSLPTTTVYSGIDESTESLALSTFYDDYGNPKRVVTITQHPTTAESWKQVVANNYYNNGADTSRWLLGKLQDATTTSTVGGAGYATSGDPTVIRKSAFTYHGYGGTCTGAVYGQLCSETVEPDSGSANATNPTLYQSTAFVYDTFGNRIRSTVSYYEPVFGASTTYVAATRSSESEYSVGKYPTKVTRKFIGDATRDLVELRDYGTTFDNRCRSLKKLTDANGNYAVTGYDGLCRKNSEAAFTNDNLLARQTIYTLSTNSLISGERYALTTTSTDGSQSIQFYDDLQRVVRARTKQFDFELSGAYSEARSLYDGLGRQIGTSKMVSGASAAPTAANCFGVSWTVPSGSAVSCVDYDRLNRPVTEALPDGNKVTTEYQGLTTNVTRENSTAGAGSAQTRSTSKTVNAKGMVETITTAATASAPATTVTNKYDAIGNLTQVETPGPSGSVITKRMIYDIRGRQTSLIDPDAGTYTYAYNGVGEQRQQKDSNLNVTSTQFDAFGRKKDRTETHPGGTATTSWTYGDSVNTCSYARGLLCSVTYSVPAYGSMAAAVTSKSTRFDPYSRPVATETVIDGQTFTSQIAYDNQGRPKLSVYPQATPASEALSVRTLYNASGFVSEIQHANTGYSYWKVGARGADGQLTQATQGGVITVNQLYGTDGMGRVARINVASGVGQPIPVSGSGLLNQSFAFDSVGNLKTRTLSSDGAGRAESEAFTYDSLDRLLASAAGAGNVTALPDVGSYGYDAAGNLVTRAGVSNTYNTNSGGNPLLNNNRLCGINSATCTGTVGYDLNGNITQYTRPGAASGLPGADGATMALSGYTAFNLPTLVTKASGSTVQASAEFAYDAGYQRVRQIKRSGAATTGLANVVDDILYVVPGGFEVRRDGTQSSGARPVLSSIATIAGPDGVVATVTTNYDADGQASTLRTVPGTVSGISGSLTVTKLLLKDHLGSMVAEVVVVGDVDLNTKQVIPATVTIVANTLAIHGFGPWGNARNGLNADQRGFTGHEHLAELGLIHMNGRLYDPVLGRFLQADPVIQAPHNAQSHNRYVYVLNNPLSFTDPSGFSWWTTWRRPIFAIATAWFLGPTGFFASQGGIFGALTGVQVGVSAGSVISTANAVSSVMAGFAAGGIQGGNIQSALQGAFTAGLMQGLLAGFDLPHGAPGTIGEFAGKVAVHAAVGCVGGAMAGGGCGRGAAAGGFAEFAGTLAGAGPMGQLGLQEGSPAHFAAQVAAGCAAGRIGGGKCSNGAYTAAFNYTVNIWGRLAAPMLLRLAVWATPRIGIIEEGAYLAAGVANGAGVAGAAGAATRILGEVKAGEIFVSEVNTAKGVLEIGGKVSINDKTLRIDGLMVYTKGESYLGTGIGDGLREVLAARNFLVEEARALGYEFLHVTGVRLSGANPGKIIDTLIDLRKP